MAARRFINQFVEQEQVDEVFRVADKQLRANRQGGKYILLRLADRSGNLVAMHWNADEKIFESFQRGDYLHCRGRTQLYNGGLQMIVSHLEVTDAKTVDPADFDAFDSQAADDQLSKLKSLVAQLRDERLKKLVEAYLADADWVARFRLAPAAVSNHHAYPGGLLKHTLDLMELASIVAPRYPQLNADLVIVGAFLHDLGKVDELTSGGELTYTDRGQLVGHLVIGVQELQRHVIALEQKSGERFPDSLRWQLEHLILSHHGQLEFGSPKIPMTLEALVLHHLDNLDAKLASATAFMEGDVAGEGNWTNYSPSLGRKFWKGANA